MNIGELLQIQKEFDKRIEYRPTITEYLLAIKTEMFELYNATEIGKWWKVHKGKGKEKILDECADVMAFIFSFSNNYDIKIDEFYRVNLTSEIISIYEYILLSDLYSELKDLLFILPTILFNTIDFTKIIAGCTDEEIVNAYKNKVKVNHQRINDGY